MNKLFFIMVLLFLYGCNKSIIENEDYINYNFSEMFLNNSYYSWKTYIYFEDSTSTYISDSPEFKFVSMDTLNGIDCIKTDIKDVIIPIGVPISGEGHFWINENSEGLYFIQEDGNGDDITYYGYDFDLLKFPLIQNDSWQLPNNSIRTFLGIDTLHYNGVIVDCYKIQVENVTWQYLVRGFEYWVNNIGLVKAEIFPDIDLTEFEDFPDDLVNIRSEIRLINETL